MGPGDGNFGVWREKILQALLRSWGKQLQSRRPNEGQAWLKPSVIFDIHKDKELCAKSNQSPRRQGPANFEL